MKIDFDDLISGQNIIIDIRDYPSYSRGHIMGAINVPYQQLKKIPNQFLKTNETYFLYCEYGTQSKKLCDYLIELGFDVYNIDGGYDSYLKLLKNKLQ